VGVLQDAGVQNVYHYAPLHCLPIIARDRELLGKPSLAERGFSQTHLRSKSSRHDINRGFGDYAFLTLDDDPRILKAKLGAGFPHIGIGVATADVENTTFDLCRFNVAMTRKLRRNGKPGHDASPIRSNRKRRGNFLTFEHEELTRERMDQVLTELAILSFDVSQLHLQLIHWLPAQND